MNTSKIFSKRNGIILAIVLVVLVAAGVTLVLIKTHTDDTATKSTDAQQITDTPTVSKDELDARKRVSENQYAEALALFEKALAQATSGQDKERIASQIEMTKAEIEAQSIPENLEQSPDAYETTKQPDGSMLIVPILEP